jgi:hypothetical protein
MRTEIQAVRKVPETSIRILLVTSTHLLADRRVRD